MSWLLLRGLIREQRHWGDFPQKLQQAFPAESILCLDLPGNGSLYQADSPLSIAQMVESLRSALRAREVQTPLKVLAMSLGAMVAIAWAERYPDEISALVLINTSLAPHNPFYQRLRPQNYGRLLSTMLTGSVEDKEACVLALTSNHPPADSAALLADWAHFARQCPVSRRNALRQLLAAVRYRSPARAPAVPALLLNGAADRLVSPACSHTLARQWHLPLRTHPTAGHDLPLDDAGWVQTLPSDQRKT